MLCISAIQLLTGKLRKRGISKALLEEVVFEVGGEFYTEMGEKHPKQSETQAKAGSSTGERSDLAAGSQPGCASVSLGNW